MREGDSVGSLIWLNAIHLARSAPPADWSKTRSVFLPMLKLCQVRKAWDVVCLMPTCVRPPATVCTGRLAPRQSVEPGVVAPGATCRPPAPSPSGTVEALVSAAARASVCMRLMSRSVRLARARASRLLINVCSRRAPPASPSPPAACEPPPDDAEPRRNKSAADKEQLWAMMAARAAAAVRFLRRSFIDDQGAVASRSRRASSLREMGFSWRRRAR